MYVADFQSMVTFYRKRNKSLLIDGIMSSLSFVDETVVSMGAVLGTGLWADLLNATSIGLPFIVVAIDEGGKVFLRKKTKKAGLQDASHRMLLNLAALGVGSTLCALGLPLLTVPAAASTRMVLDRYKSQSLTKQRVIQRTQRVQALHDRRQKRMAQETQPLHLSAGSILN